MITLLADQNIPYLEHYIRGDVQLITFNPDNGLPPNIEADALFVRTVTMVNQKTLSPSMIRHLQFVATASVGTDHLDIPFLESTGIKTQSAAGCNARAVAEYVCTGLFHWASSRSIDPGKLTIGIVGAGNTGSAVEKLLRRAGLTTITNDPPRARWDKTFENASIEDILSCDVITFHVPLITEGSDKTYHWLKQEQLDRSQARLVINASRGGVVDESALSLAYTSGSLGDYILDVWEGEPLPNSSVMKNAWLATPHIAGYSVQAKHKATSQICDLLYQHFGIDQKTIQEPALTTAEFAEAQRVQFYLNELASTKENELTEPMHTILENTHPAFHLSNELKKGADYQHSELSGLFRELRTGYPLRNEYAQFSYPNELLRKFPVLNALLSS